MWNTPFLNNIPIKELRQLYKNLKEDKQTSVSPEVTQQINETFS